MIMYELKSSESLHTNHGNKQVNMLAETLGNDTHMQSQVIRMNLKFIKHRAINIS